MSDQHLIKEIQNLKREVALLKEGLTSDRSRYGTDLGQLDIGKVVDNHEKRLARLEDVNRPRGQ